MLDAINTFPAPKCHEWKISMAKNEASCSKLWCKSRIGGLRRNGRGNELIELTHAGFSLEKSSHKKFGRSAWQRWQMPLRSALALPFALGLAFAVGSACLGRQTTGLDRINQIAWEELDGNWSGNVMFRNQKEKLLHFRIKHLATWWKWRRSRPHLAIKGQSPITLRIAMWNLRPSASRTPFRVKCLISSAMQVMRSWKVSWPSSPSFS